MNHADLSVPKRPHYLPAVYLRAWTDETGRVAVRRRVTKQAFVTAVGNIGSEAGLYGYGDTARGREKMFGTLEGDWPRLRNELISSGEIRSQDRDAVALFAALQFTRTRESIARRNFVASVAEFTDERPISRATIRRFLIDEHLKFIPKDAEVEGAWTLVTYLMNKNDLPTSDDTFSMAIDVAVRELAPTLSRMTWTVETCRKPILFTSDRSIMCWRPRSYRDRFEGIGIGNSDEIRLPLDPQNLLVLRRTAKELPLVRVEPKRFVHVNSDIASQCFEFVVTRRNRLGDLNRLQLAKHLPTLRFNMAGRDQPMGDILHTWVPVRQA